MAGCPSGRLITLMLRRKPGLGQEENPISVFDNNLRVVPNPLSAQISEQTTFS